eukprot:SAG22_NODE_1176_length_5248_cov_3.965819_2_plen_1088_part_00
MSGSVPQLAQFRRASALAAAQVEAELHAAAEAAEAASDYQTRRQQRAAHELLTTAKPSARQQHAAAAAYFDAKVLQRRRKNKPGQPQPLPQPEPPPPPPWEQGRSEQAVAAAYYSSPAAPSSLAVEQTSAATFLAGLDQKEAEYHAAALWPAVPRQPEQPGHAQPARRQWFSADPRARHQLLSRRFSATERELARQQAGDPANALALADKVARPFWLPGKPSAGWKTYRPRPVVRARHGELAWRVYGPLTPDWIPVPESGAVPLALQALSPKPRQRPSPANLLSIDALRQGDAPPAAAAALRPPPPPIPAARRRYTRPAGAGSDPDWLVLWYWVQPAPPGTGTAHRRPYVEFRRSQRPRSSAGAGAVAPAPADAGLQWRSEATVCSDNSGWVHSQPVFVGVDDPLEPADEEPLWSAAQSAELAGALAEAEDLYLQLADEAATRGGSAGAAVAERCLFAVAALAEQRSDGAAAVAAVRGEAEARRLRRLGGTPGGLHPAAPAWELSVWVDGEPAGTFDPDAQAVVLGFPPPAETTTTTGGGERRCGSRSRLLSARPPLATYADHRRLSASSTASSSVPSRPEDERRWMPSRWEAAAAAHAAGDIAMAEELFLEVAESSGQDPAAAELCLYNIAVMAEQAGDYAGADEVYAEVERRCLARLHAQRLLPAMTAAVAAADQLLLRVRTGVANLLDQRGHTEAAEALCGEVAAAQAELLGEQHPDTLRSLLNLSGFKAAQGTAAGLQEAGELAAMVADALAHVSGPSSPDALLARYHLGWLKAAAGDVYAAAQLVAEVADAQAAALGRQHPVRADDTFFLVFMDLLFCICRVCRSNATPWTNRESVTLQDVLRARRSLAELLGQGGQFMQLPPPPPSGTPLGTLRVVVLAAEQLRPTRQPVPAPAAESQGTALSPPPPPKWTATTAGRGTAMLDSGVASVYMLLVAGLGGLAGRTNAAAVTDGMKGGGADWSDGSGEVCFSLQAAAPWLRFYCFDELYDDSQDGGADDCMLARRYDGDSFVGVGEFQGPHSGSREKAGWVEERWIGLEVAAADAWVESEQLLGQGSGGGGGGGAGRAGRVRVRVTWEPPQKR